MYCETYITHSAAETERVAEAFGKTLENGVFIAFTGTLGAGKTTFVRGLARAFQADAEVSSPTFSIMNQYDGAVRIKHYDMYRITDPDSLYFTGFYDDLDARNQIVVVEWSENIADVLPEEYISIHIRYGDNEMQRVIQIQTKQKGQKPC